MSLHSFQSSSTASDSSSSYRMVDSSTDHMTRSSSCHSRRNAVVSNSLTSDDIGGMIVDLDNVDAIINYVIKMQYICSE